MPERPPYPIAALVGLAVLALYVITLAPTAQFWDASEYIAAARVMGIPHPPGNPLFVLLAHVWGMIPLVPHYAMRINLFAATTSAVAAACWFLIGERWLREVVPMRMVRILAAAAGALVAATVFTVWNQSVVNEKVYTISVMSVALTMWLGLRWADRARGASRDRTLLIITYVLALTSTNHMMGVLGAPALGLLVFLTIRAEGGQPAHVAGQAGELAKWAVFCGVWGTVVLLGLENPPLLVMGGLFTAGAVVAAYLTGQWRFAVLAVLLGTVGLSVNGILPIRAGFFPPINEGEPRTWDTLMAVLTREQYGKPPITERQADFIAQLGLYWQYFTWQWSRTWQFLWGATGHRLANFLAVVFAGVGLLGGWRQWRANKIQAATMTTLVITFSLLLVFYLNFRYGYSQFLDTRPDLDREVRERDYFFIVSFAIWGIWVGMGLATLAEWVADTLRRNLDVARAWALATPVFALAAVPLAGNWLAASRAGETLARDFAVDMLTGLEPYGILVTAGDNDTFPLWYAQEVEGVRRDVIIMNLSLGNTDWHLSQLQRREIDAYDPERGPAIYRYREWPKPAGPLFNWSQDEIQQLPLFQPLRERRVFRKDSIVAVLDPARLPGGVIDRVTIGVLSAIRDQYPNRPMYFSRTSGGFPDQIGLTPYLATEGFARKLYPRVLTPNDSLVSVPGFGLLNLPRTTELLWNVYHGDTAARQRPVGWFDQPSEGILTLYAVAFGALGQALAGRDSTLAARSLQRADSVLFNTALGRQQALPFGASGGR